VHGAEERSRGEESHERTRKARKALTFLAPGAMLFSGRNGPPRPVSPGPLILRPGTGNSPSAPQDLRANEGPGIMYGGPCEKCKCHAKSARSARSIQQVPEVLTPA
jgi:hypothetical protein